MKRPALQPLAFCACGLIWGSTFLAIRIGNDTLPAVWACTLRLAAASILLSLMLVATRQPWPQGAALKAAVAYGFFEFGVGLPLLYWGERVVPSGLAAVLYALCPITAMVGANLLGMERWNPMKLGAGIFALAGVAIIFWREALVGTSIAGFCSIVLAASVSSLGALLYQRGPKQGALGANAVAVTVAMVPSAIASFALGERHLMPSTAPQILPVLYLAVMSSVIAFGMFTWLMNHWRVTTVSFLGVVVPVMGVVAGAVFRQERIEPSAALGGVIVILGVVAALRSDASAAPDVARAET